MAQVRSSALLGALAVSAQALAAYSTVEITGAGSSFAAQMPFEHFQFRVRTGDDPYGRDRLRNGLSAVFAGHALARGPALRRRRRRCRRQRVRESWPRQRDLKGLGRFESKNGPKPRIEVGWC